MASLEVIFSYEEIWEAILNLKSVKRPRTLAKFKAVKRIVDSSKRKPCKLSDLYLASRYFN